MNQMREGERERERGERIARVRKSERARDLRTESKTPMHIE